MALHKSQAFPVSDTSSPYLSSQGLGEKLTDEWPRSNLVLCAMYIREKKKIKHFV